MFQLPIVVMGIGIGMVLTILLQVNIPGSKIYIYDHVKEECEKSLPRDQHCKIIAVPIEKGEGK